MTWHLHKSLRPMLGVLLTSAAAITCLSAISSSAAPLSIDWQDHGEVRRFEVATNEFYHTESGRKFVHGQVERGESMAAARTRKTSPGKSTDIETGYIVYEAGKERNAVNARYVTRQVLIEVEPGTDVGALLKDLSARRIDHSVVRDPQLLIEVNTADEVFDLQTRISKSLNAAGRVKSIEPQLARIRPHRAVTPNDTLFPQQWHLLNTGQNGGTAGIDVGLGNTWNTYRGAGIVIGIVDEGVQTNHPDLSAGILSAYGFDWNDNDTDPNPTGTSENHATSVAGVAAARGSNGVGVVGVAYEAGIAAFRLTASGVTDAQEAAAMTNFNNVIHVKNNSWGPDDYSNLFEEPGTLTKQALADGAKLGRGGRGTIYVWAGGNGGSSTYKDNSNYDGYANSIYTIAVCAISDQGDQASYSEPGANLVVGAPSSSDFRQGIVTTDRTGNNGYNTSGTSTDLSDKDYTKTFGGTSSACPAVSGSVALILQANPLLGWRDVQEVLMRSATKNSPTDSDWITNAAGIHFNHKFGAGLINVSNALSLATNWFNLPAQTNILRTNIVSLAIPDNSTGGVTNTFANTIPNIRVEHVTVKLNITHPWRGDLHVELISPSGTKSVLQDNRSPLDHNSYSTAGWKYMTVRNWGEMADGTWKVVVSDRAAQDTGTLTRVELQIFGSDINTPTYLTRSESGGQMQLQWPADHGAFVLQSATNLSNVSPWSNFSTTLTSIGNQKRATVPMTNSLRVFRLTR